MFEALSLIIFAGVMYFCLVLAPTMAEFFTSEEFKKNYFKHLTKSVH